MNSLKLSIGIPIWYRTNGCKAMRITGPNKIPDPPCGIDTIYRLEMFISNMDPKPDDVGDFFIDIDNATAFTLRNGLSALILATDQR